MNLPAEVRVRASELPSVIRTVEEAIRLIDRNQQPDLARLASWTFARALLAEVMQTRKSSDMKAAVRQLRQALQNENGLTSGCEAGRFDPAAALRQNCSSILASCFEPTAVSFVGGET